MTTEKYVCKFGGTSMADAAAMRQAAEIVKADPRRRYIVVSAPGKRSAEDEKITDLLYACHAEAAETGSCAASFAPVRERFVSLVRELALDIPIEAYLNEAEAGIAANADTPDYAASRGEYLSAIVFAALLGYEFADAAQLIRFDSGNKLNEAYTNDKIKTVLTAERAVIPGFYGKNSLGKIVTFSRGGSDISGAIVARGVEASLYENWTDVSGFLFCDPRIVENPRRIRTVTYKELRELSYMGASVLHAESIFPVMKGRIPINVRNTFDPEDPGTMIVPIEKYESKEVITGVAGRKNFTVIFIEKSMMNAEVGFIRKVLSVLEHYGVRVEHVPTGIDTLSVVVASYELSGGVLSDVVSEIRENVNPDYVHVIENISLVATVGHGMARKAGVAARLFGALARDNINMLMIDQGSSELNIIVGVANSDYENCIRSIYREFVGEA